MWNCVEDRVDTGNKYGRVVRKIVFEKLYPDRTSVLTRQPIETSTLIALQVLHR